MNIPSLDASDFSAFLLGVTISSGSLLYVEHALRLGKPIMLVLVVLGGFAGIAVGRYRQP